MRVIGADPLLKNDVAAQRTPHLVLAARPDLVPLHKRERITIQHRPREGISAAC